MTQYDNNMRGIISRNDRKQTDKHPDIKGQCEIDGKHYWIDGWQKSRSSDGSKFYSLSFKPKVSGVIDSPVQQKPKAAEAFDIEDDIPF